MQECNCVINAGNQRRERLLAKPSPRFESQQANLQHNLNVSPLYVTSILAVIEKELIGLVSDHVEPIVFF